MEIDLNALIPGSKYFRWKEILWLDTWKVYVVPTDIQYLNTLKFVKKLDLIRKYLDTEMIITSGIRPVLYNKWSKPYGIDGAFLSWHVKGRAADFVTPKIKADRVKELLEPVLDDFDLRMEDLPGSNWVHVDDGKIGKTGRFFKTKAK